MDWIYGIHTIQSMLKSAPERVTEIFVQGNRRDERLQKIRHLADLHGISVQPLVAHKLEARVNGRHQGVIARCKPGKTYDENFLLQLAEDKGKESFFLFTWLSLNRLVLLITFILTSEKSTMAIATTKTPTIMPSLVLAASPKNSVLFSVSQNCYIISKIISDSRFDRLFF